MTEQLDYQRLLIEVLTITTDSEALARLPPHQTVIDWYCALRCEGMEPAEAHEATWQQYNRMAQQLPNFMKGIRE